MALHVGTNIVIGAYLVPSKIDLIVVDDCLGRDTVEEHSK